MGGDVFHVAHVLVAAFNLEAAHARINQGAQVVALVVVFHAEDMLVVRDEAALRVSDLVGQATGLAAVAPVGAAPGLRVADVALSAVRHAQRAVNEKLDIGAPRRIHRPQCLVHCRYLLHREFAGQHDLRQSCVLQKTGFLGRADVGLGAGVQLDGRQVQLEHAHVLHDQRICARVVHLPCHLARGFQFIVAQDGVQGDEDAAVEAVGMAHQALNVADAVARARACAKRGASDVDSIGAVVDGFDANVCVARGGQQFELVGQ